MSIGLVLVAAGRGTRAGGGVPKQYRPVLGQPVIAWSLRAFDGVVSERVIVHHPDDIRHLDGLLETDPDLILVQGGATRHASVRAGLAALRRSDRVLIHDAARPLLSAAVIGGVTAALNSNVAAAPAVAVSDALWRGAEGYVTGTEAREGLYRAQTPQGFRLEDIRAAHRAHTGDAADDVAVARAAGLDVAITQGDEDNIKITTPEDFARAAQHLAARREQSTMDIRLGNGFDVHRFGPGDHVMLCGVSIPHGRGLQGHSDADVGLHTITDAIYGALAQGDIGTHFPPSDPQWKGAASDIFLRHATARAHARGYRIGNVDCTLICEAPKIGPHGAQMRAKVAEIMRISPDVVSVKATTSERLGFTGREEGIACLATVSLISP